MISHEKSTETNNLFEVPFYPFNHLTGCIKCSDTTGICLVKLITYLMIVSFPFWHILTPHSTICPYSSPSHRWQHQSHPYILKFFLCHLIHYNHCTLWSPFPHPITSCCCCCCPSCNTTCTQHLSSRIPPLLLTPSLCLIMALDQNMRIFLFLCQWQILIQTMNPLWVYEPTVSLWSPSPQSPAYGWPPCNETLDGLNGVGACLAV